VYESIREREETKRGEGEHKNNAYGENSGRETGRKRLPLSEKQNTFFSKHTLE
jgi:hypothetical protein